MGGPHLYKKRLIFYNLFFLFIHKVLLFCGNGKLNFFCVSVYFFPEVIAKIGFEGHLLQTRTTILLGPNL